MMKLTPYLRTPPRVLLPGVQLRTHTQWGSSSPGLLYNSLFKLPVRKNTVQNDLQVISINLRYKKVALLTSLVLETFEVGTVAQTDKIRD